MSAAVFQLFGMPGRGHEEIRFVQRDGEGHLHARAHHADDFKGAAIQADGLAHDGRIASVACLPELVPQDRHLGPAEDILSGLEIPPQDRACSQGGKEAAGH